MKKSKMICLVLTLALLCSRSACGGEGEPSPSPTAAPTESAAPSPAPTEAPGTAEFVLSCYPSAGFHPITGQNRTNLTLAPLMYEGLFELDETFAPHNVLCESHAVSEDGLTWTFTLKAAAFSDGSALTAADVVHSLQRAQGEDSVYAGRLSGVRSIREAEAGVEVVLSAPNGNLPALLDIPIVKENGEAPLGTGPYVLTGEGEELSLTAVDGWWQNKTLPLTSIRLCSVQGADGLIHAFDTREVSLVTADITGSNALGYSGSYEVWDYPTSIMLYVGYNTQSGPCRDSEVRRALSYGYERTAVAKSLFAQHAAAACLPVSPASPLYSQALADTLAYSPQRVEELLEGAGWLLSDGVRTKGREALTLTFVVNTDNSYKVSAAEYLTELLSREGIAVELKKLPWEDYVAALEGGEFDLYLGEVKLTADFDLTALLAPGGTLNYGAFADGETQDLLAAYLAADAAGRSEAAQALYRQIARTAPFTPICFKSWSVLTHWGKIAGLNPTQQNVFYGFSNWKPGR